MNIRKIGKWEKDRWMRKHFHLAQAMPETDEWSEGSFHTFLSRYGKVIIKPVNGSWGSGILVVTRRSADRYAVQMATKRIILNESDVYRYISSVIKNRPYLIQNFISLASIGGRPIDVRVMTQLDEANKWIITGRLVKVARPGFIISNPEEKVLPLSSLFKHVVSPENSKAIITRMDELAILASEHLQQAYPQISIVGFDIALDTDGKLWIIEANFAPMVSLFRYLPDHSSYHTIRKYKKIKRGKSPRPQSGTPNQFPDDDYYYYS